jgi:hypothetical protein
MPPGRTEIRRQALLREIGSRSATLTPRTRWRIVLPAALASTIVIVVAYIGFLAISGTLTASEATLTASWTAIPTPVGPNDHDAMERACQQRLRRAHWPVTVDAMTPVLVERRGHLTAILMRGDGQYGMCVGDPQDPLFVGVGLIGEFDPAAGLHLEGHPGQRNGRNAFRVVYGQVAPAVTGVVIETFDGKAIDATVHGGRFFAWWPSGADPKTMTATSGDGSVVAVVDQPLPQPPGTPTRRPGTS